MQTAMLLTAGGTDMMTSYILLAGMFVIMYFILIRPPKKREKEMAAMRAALEVGDEVITNGGIVGLVVSIKDDTVLIETGSDRVKIRIMKNAILQNTTALEAAAEKKTEKKTEKKK